MSPELSTYPKACSAEAYYRFVDALPRLETTDGLVDAAIALSMHALDDVDPTRVRQEIAGLGRRVTERVRSGSRSAVLAHLHEVLFAEEGFTGNNEQQYFALNSYLPAVLRTKAGLPILLSLLYKAVGEQVGLQVEGISAPGHFMIRVPTDEGPAIVDPFFGGVLLSREEFFQRLERVNRRPVPRDDRYLVAATHTQWLARILANLISFFSADRRRGDLAAMLELRQALEEVRP